MKEQETLTFPPLMERLRPLLLEQEPPVYLVGGAVRDALLGRMNYDLDFVVARDASALAFRVADSLGVPAFVLDRERDIARVVLADDTDLDFARFRGPHVEADLRARDFTINAMALPLDSLQRAHIIDPAGGLSDLSRGLIRRVYRDAIRDDPVRALRAVRLAVTLRFDVDEETREVVRHSAAELHAVSPERVRDELLKSLQSPAPGVALTLLRELALLPEAVPEIARLEGVEQSAPHHEPVLEHTVTVLRYLAEVEAGVLESDRWRGESLSRAREVLQPYRRQLADHLSRRLDGGVQGTTLLRLGALFHDVGKAETRTVEPDGRVRFLGHERVGAEICARRLRALRLSKQAVGHVRQIVAGHMRPLWLRQGEKLTRRAVFRFFRATGAAGLDIGLLSLADHLATHDGPGPQEDWEALLRVVQRLYEHYFEAYDRIIAPTPLLGGGELIAALDLTPGPIVGRLLRLIEEAQAAGEISTKEEALELARKSR